MRKVLNNAFSTRTLAIGDVQTQQQTVGTLANFEPLQVQTESFVCGPKTSTVAKNCDSSIRFVVFGDGE